jgi:hypothetical protein
MDQTTHVNRKARTPGMHVATILLVASGRRSHPWAHYRIIHSCRKWCVSWGA